jgi:hypothetical protein
MICLSRSVRFVRAIDLARACNAELATVSILGDLPAYYTSFAIGRSASANYDCFFPELPTRKGTDYDISVRSTARTSSSSQAVLASGIPGFDIRHEFCGATSICGFDAIDARAGDQSSPEAKPLNSPPQSFCRENAK